MDRKKILFLTNSNFGQANVILATAHSLVQISPDPVEIHIASFRKLESAVHDASNFALKTLASKSPPSSNDEVTKPATPFIFHGIDGTMFFEAAWEPKNGIVDLPNLCPGLINTAKLVSRIPTALTPWSPEEYLSIYWQTERVLDEVKPDLVVVDPLFSPGLSLCSNRNRATGDGGKKLNWTVLAPNTVKDFVLPQEPGMAMFWKYPFIASALPFPVPWFKILHNIIFVLVAVFAHLTDRGTKAVSAALRKYTKDPSTEIVTVNELGVLKPPPFGLRILIPGGLDLDYPFSSGIPKYLTSCGPIVRAVDPLPEGSEMMVWLKRGPTVYVNIGTQLKATAAEAVEMAKAFRDVLDLAEANGAHPEGRKLQILWKLGRKVVKGEAEIEKDRFDGECEEVCDILRPEIEDGRVRITDWIEAEPKSILESGCVVCSVNHGGANSFYEAVCAGIPQVLLPAWFDCFDFGNRVELLGIGRWANKEAKPRWEQYELVNSIQGVLFGEDAEAIKEQCMAFGEAHPEHAGRDNAARELLGMLQA